MPLTSSTLQVSTHAVVDHGLHGVLESLAEAVALQYVDDAEVQQQTLSLRVARRDTTGTET